MQNLATQSVKPLTTELVRFNSASMILQQLTHRYQIQKADQILDLGPACQENIRFFSNYTKRYHICDLPAQLDRVNQDNKLSFNILWQQFDYPADTFDCINLWDLLDHISDFQAPKIIQRCQTALKLNGLVSVMAKEQSPDASITSLFTCGIDCHLSLRSLPHLKLPWYHRHNRTLISLFEPLKTVGIFRYQNGIRELLFQCTPPIT